MENYLYLVFRLEIVWGNYAVLGMSTVDWVMAGVVEEVSDRHDVFAGICDTVPQLPQPDQFQHQSYGAGCSHR